MMHRLKMFIFLWLLHWLNLSCQDSAHTEVTDIITNAQYLCPRTRFCDKPPLSQTPPPKGEVPCCRDCSCQQDCVKRNTCCFPSKIGESKHDTTRRECLYPEVITTGVSVLGGASYKMVVDVTNCNNKTVKALSNNMKSLSNNFTTSSYRNDSSCEECGSQGTKCAECKCNMDEAPVKVDQMVTKETCLCDKPINKDGGCRCGDAKVAPWGSIFPVYSKQTGLMYKNSVCAACQGITDGVQWIPGIVCTDITEFIDIESVISKAAVGEIDCVIYFKEPENFERPLLPRCFDMSDKCDSNFAILYGLNMSAKQVIDACKSNFNSPQKVRRKNVFCAICSNSYRKTDRCLDDGGLKSVNGRLSFLLTLDFVKEITVKLAIINHPTACSSMRPSDCREILCSTGQVRYANGACKYPMSATYVSGYALFLRLSPIEYKFGLDLKSLVSKGKVLFEHLISPWPRKWISSYIFFESSRLASSGRLKDTSAFIVVIGLPDPVKNQTLVLSNVRHLLQKKWILKVNNITINLRSEILEHTSFRQNKNFYSPSTTPMLLETPTPVWILIYKLKIPPYSLVGKLNSMLIITKLMFCEQIALDPLLDEYELLAGNRVLYFKSENKYIFQGNFAFDENGLHKVRICLDDTHFVKQRASLPSRNTVGTIAFIYIWINAFLI